MLKKKYGSSRIFLFNARQMIICLIIAACFALIVKTYLFLFAPPNKETIENASLIIVILLTLYLFSPSTRGFDLVGGWFSRYLHPGDIVRFYWPAEMLVNQDELPDRKTEGKIISIMNNSLASVEIEGMCISLPVSCITMINTRGC